MNRAFIPLALVAGLATTGCQSSDDDRGANLVISGDGSPIAQASEDEEVVSPDQIPQLVKEAALAAVPGLVIQEAEKEGDGVFCVHGTVDGVFTEVEVTTTGEILEIEQGDEEDSDDGEDDADDDADDDDEADDEGEEEQISLDEVPQAVKDAAMPGLVLEEAEVETEDGVLAYDLEGSVDGVEYEIEVSADGVVLGIEEDEDDDDEDDD